MFQLRRKVTIFHSLKGAIMNRVLIFLSVLLLSYGSTYFAQDTVYVPWQENGVLIENTLIDYIVADTNAAGEQLHQVYKLERGGSYLIDRTIAVNNPIEIVCDPADRTDANAAPPVVRIKSLDASTPAAGLFFSVGADLTVKNIYFAGMGTQDVWMDGNWASVTAPNIKIYTDGCYFDYMGWSIITNFTNFPEDEGSDYIIINSYIKNNQNPGDPNSPFWYLGTAPVDTIIAKNTTYFQSHGYFIQPVGAPINYLEIDHCTFVNNLEMNVLHSRLTNAKITNNIYYNTQAAGQSDEENADKDADGLDWSIVNVDTLLGNEAGASDSLASVTMPEADRKIEVHNNAWFRSADIVAYHEDNGLHAGLFMNDRTQAFFDNNAEWPGLNESNNVNEEPVFGNIAGANELQLGYVRAYRGIEGSQEFWGFESDTDEYPDLFRVFVEWPFSEDLSHTGLSITGTDGEPLGDLQWVGKTITDVEESSSEIPAAYALEQNYPNPFNPSTTIKFNLPEASVVRLSVYNILGQEVAQLVNDELTAGSYQYAFDATNLSSGVYIYSIHANNFVQTRKMMLLK